MAEAGAGGHCGGGVTGADRGPPELCRASTDISHIPVVSLAVTGLTTVVQLATVSHTLDKTVFWTPAASHTAGLILEFNCGPFISFSKLSSNCLQPKSGRTPHTGSILWYFVKCYFSQSVKEEGMKILFSQLFWLGIVLHIFLWLGWNAASNSAPHSRPRHFPICLFSAAGSTFHTLKWRCNIIISFCERHAVKSREAPTLWILDRMNINWNTSLFLQGCCVKFL